MKKLNVKMIGVAAAPAALLALAGCGSAGTAALPQESLPVQAVSAPAEAACIPLYSLAAGFSGTLRGAYNSWTANPLQDARFRTWVGGDCDMVYPGASSLRFERLREGLVLAEKIRLLREEYTRTRNTEALRLLNEEVARFVRQPITHANAALMVNRLRAFINGL